MFESSLARVVSQTGALGAAVVSLDGLTIDAVNARGAVVPPDEASREWASVFKQLVGVADAMEIGQIVELAVGSEDEMLLVRMLTANYFVALRVTHEVPPGKGRFYLRVVAPDIVREL